MSQSGKLWTESQYWKTEKKKIIVKDFLAFKQGQNFKHYDILHWIHCRHAYLFHTKIYLVSTTELKA